MPFCQGRGSDGCLKLGGSHRLPAVLTLINAALSRAHLSLDLWSSQPNRTEIARRRAGPRFVLAKSKVSGALLSSLTGGPAKPRGALALLTSYSRDASGRQRCTGKGNIVQRVLVMLTMVVITLTGCSGPPQTDPAPSARIAREPVDYGTLKQALEQSIVDTAIGEPTIAAVLVSVDGATEIAHYRHGQRADQAIHVSTATPTVLSALVGIAVGERLIEDLDQTLPELVPGYAADMSREQRAVTLRQLLAMAGGFAYDYGPDRPFVIFNGQGDPDPTRKIIRQGLDTAPGSHFYSSASAHLASAVLREALRRTDGDRPRSVLQYAQEKLFDPLGIDTSPAYARTVRLPDLAFERLSMFGWGTDRTGLNSGCCLLRLRPADMVKIGELYLRGGVWRGQRILPAGWVEESTRAVDGGRAYGLGWFHEQHLGRTVWLTRSVDGQMIAVVPDHALVVVVGSVPGVDAAIPDQDLSPLLTDVVLPALG